MRCGTSCVPHSADRERKRGRDDGPAVLVRVPRVVLDGDPEEEDRKSLRELDAGLGSRNRGQSGLPA